MEDLFEKMRAATATDATDEIRATGAQACRTLLVALESTPGAPLTESISPSASPAAAPPTPHAAVHALVSALRGMTADQLMDLAISRLRTALPPGVDVPAVKSLRFPLAPLTR